MLPRLLAFAAAGTATLVASGTSATARHNPNISLRAQRYYLRHAFDPRVQTCFPGQLHKPLPDPTGTGTSAVVVVHTMSSSQFRAIVRCMKSRI